MANAIKASSIVVGSTSAVIPRLIDDGYSKMRIKNMGDVDVYIGEEDIVTASGYPIFAQTAEEFEFDTELDVYIVCAAGEAPTVKILETR